MVVVEKPDGTRYTEPPLTRRQVADLVKRSHSP
jgi:hypothetical protein